MRNRILITTIIIIVVENLGKTRLYLLIKVYFNLSSCIITARKSLSVYK